MGAELADALGLGGSTGNLSSLLGVATVTEDRSGVTEEQAAAVALLGDLPERDWNLTRQLQELGAFRALATKLVELRRGTIRGNRHVAPFTEGAVKVLYRVTCALALLQQEETYVELAREVGLAPLFVELLQQMMSSGQEAVLLYSAMALENLSLQSSRYWWRTGRRRCSGGRCGPWSASCASRTSRWRWRPTRPWRPFWWRPTATATSARGRRRSARSATWTGSPTSPAPSTRPKAGHDPCVCFLAAVPSPSFHLFVHGT
ncbi:U-box domain-containing protein 44 [Zea mays]|uniref:U-box domain-containing protein 44 n=1 Tax=Zea mays TaxID=4577 RepID=A0A1D6Q9Z5_MAIZE|nr:U-box domain-containing protein 44 [Zea mays]